LLQPIPCDKNEFGTVAQARQIFDENFLSIRAKLIEIAAVLDRIDRQTQKTSTSTSDSCSECDVNSDPRRARIDQAISLLLQDAAPAGEQPDEQVGNRAAALQQLFSRPYDPQWRDRFDI
jgi:hypothetical protein